jgi:hypothetical protein
MRFDEWLKKRDLALYKEVHENWLWDAGKRFTRGAAKFDDLAGLTGKFLRVIPKATLATTLAMGGSPAMQQRMPGAIDNTPVISRMDTEYQPQQKTSNADLLYKKLVGSQIDQGVDDVEDVWPDEEIARRRKNAEDANLTNQIYVGAPPDPGYVAKAPLDPTVPKKRRLTPQMRAKERAKLRKRQDG